MPFQALLFQIKLTWRLLQDPRVPLWKKTIPFLGLLYVLSPIDIIPAVIVGLGQIDDLGLMFLSLRLFEGSIPSEILEQHRAILEGRAPDNIVITTDDYSVKSNGKAKRKPKSTTKS
jgi:uncharacterized membrane protein YkvA (DUF1232 family)